MTRNVRGDPLVSFIVNHHNTKDHKDYGEKMFSPTLPGVLSPLHLCEGKAVVPVQQITCVTPYTNP